MEARLSYVVADIALRETWCVLLRPYDTLGDLRRRIAQRLSARKDPPTQPVGFDIFNAEGTLLTPVADANDLHEVGVVASPVNPMRNEAPALAQPTQRTAHDSFGSYTTAAADLTVVDVDTLDRTPPSEALLDSSFLCGGSSVAAPAAPARADRHATVYVALELEAFAEFCMARRAVGGGQALREGSLPSTATSPSPVTLVPSAEWQRLQLDALCVAAEDALMRGSFARLLGFATSAAAVRAAAQGPPRLFPSNHRRARSATTAALRRRLAAALASKSASRLQHRTWTKLLTLQHNRTRAGLTREVEALEQANYELRHEVAASTSERQALVEQLARLETEVCTRAHAAHKAKSAALADTARRDGTIAKLRHDVYCAAVRADGLQQHQRRSLRACVSALLTLHERARRVRAFGVLQRHAALRRRARAAAAASAADAQAVVLRGELARAVAAADELRVARAATEDMMELREARVRQLEGTVAALEAGIPRFREVVLSRTGVCLRAMRSGLESSLLMRYFMKLRNAAVYRRNVARERAYADDLRLREREYFALADRHEEAKRSLAAAVADVAELSTRNQRLRRDLECTAHAAKQIAMYETEALALKTSRDNLRRELTSYKARLDEVLRDLTAKDSDLLDAQALAASLTCALDASRVNHQRAVEDLHAAHTRTAAQQTATRGYQTAIAERDGARAASGLCSRYYRRLLRYTRRQRQTRMALLLAMKAAHAVLRRRFADLHRSVCRGRLLRRRGAMAGARCRTAAWVLLVRYYSQWSQWFELRASARRGRDDERVRAARARAVRDEASTDKAVLQAQRDEIDALNSALRARDALLAESGSLRAELEGEVAAAAAALRRVEEEKYALTVVAHSTPAAESVRRRHAGADRASHLQGKAHTALLRRYFTTLQRSVHWRTVLACAARCATAEGDAEAAVRALHAMRRELVAVEAEVRYVKEAAAAEVRDAVAGAATAMRGGQRDTAQSLRMATTLRGRLRWYTMWRRWAMHRRGLRVAEARCGVLQHHATCRTLRRWWVRFMALCMHGRRRVLRGTCAAAVAAAASRQLLLRAYTHLRTYQRRGARRAPSDQQRIAAALLQHSRWQHLRRAWGVLTAFRLCARTARRRSHDAALAHWRAAAAENLRIAAARRMLAPYYARLTQRQCARARRNAAGQLAASSRWVLLRRRFADLKAFAAARRRRRRHATLTSGLKAHRLLLFRYYHSLRAWQLLRRAERRGAVAATALRGDVAALERSNAAAVAEVQLLYEEQAALEATARTLREEADAAAAARGVQQQQLESLRIRLQRAEDDAYRATLLSRCGTPTASTRRRHAALLRAATLAACNQRLVLRTYFMHLRGLLKRAHPAAAPHSRRGCTPGTHSDHTLTTVAKTQRTVTAALALLAHHNLRRRYFAKVLQVGRSRQRHQRAAAMSAACAMALQQRSYAKLAAFKTAAEGRRRRAARVTATAADQRTLGRYYGQWTAWRAVRRMTCGLRAAHAVMGERVARMEDDAARDEASLRALTEQNTALRESVAGYRASLLAEEARRARSERELRADLEALQGDLRKTRYDSGIAETNRSATAAALRRVHARTKAGMLQRHTARVACRGGWAALVGYVSLRHTQRRAAVAEAAAATARTNAAAAVSHQRGVCLRGIIAAAEDQLLLRCFHALHARCARGRVWRAAARGVAAVARAAELRLLGSCWRRFVVVQQRRAARGSRTHAAAALAAGALRVRAAPAYARLDAYRATRAVRRLPLRAASTCEAAAHNRLRQRHLALWALWVEAKRHSAAAAAADALRTELAAAERACEALEVAVAHGEQERTAVVYNMQVASADAAAERRAQQARAMQQRSACLAATTRLRAMRRAWTALAVYADAHSASRGAAALRAIDARRAVNAADTAARVHTRSLLQRYYVIFAAWTQQQRAVRAHRSARLQAALQVVTAATRRRALSVAYARLLQLLRRSERRRQRGRWVREHAQQVATGMAAGYYRKLRVHAVARRAAANQSATEARLVHANAAHTIAVAAATTVRHTAVAALARWNAGVLARKYYIMLQRRAVHARVRRAQAPACGTLLQHAGIHILAYRFAAWGRYVHRRRAALAATEAGALHTALRAARDATEDECRAKRALETDLARVSEQHHATLTELEGATADAAVLHGALRTAQRGAAASAAQLEAARREIDGLEATCGDLQRRLRRSGQEERGQAAALAELREAKCALEQQLADATDRARVAAKAVLQREVDVVALQGDVDRLHDVNAACAEGRHIQEALSADLSAQRALSDSLRADVARLTADLHTAHAAADRLRYDFQLHTDTSNAERDRCVRKARTAAAISLADVARLTLLRRVWFALDSKRRARAAIRALSASSSAALAAARVAAVRMLRASDSLRYRQRAFSMLQAYRMAARIHRMADAADSAAAARVADATAAAVAAKQYRSSSIAEAVAGRSAHTHLRMRFTVWRWWGARRARMRTLVTQSVCLARAAAVACTRGAWARWAGHHRLRRGQRQQRCACAVMRVAVERHLRAVAYAKLLHYASGKSTARRFEEERTEALKAHAAAITRSTEEMLAVQEELAAGARKVTALEGSLEVSKQTTQAQKAELMAALAAAVAHEKDALAAGHKVRSLQERVDAETAATNLLRSRLERYQASYDSAKEGFRSAIDKELETLRAKDRVIDDMEAAAQALRREMEDLRTAVAENDIILKEKDALLRAASEDALAAAEREAEEKDNLRVDIAELKTAARRGVEEADMRMAELHAARAEVERVGAQAADVRRELECLRSTTARTGAEVHANARATLAALAEMEGALGASMREAEALEAANAALREEGEGLIQRLHETVAEGAMRDRENTLLQTRLADALAKLAASEDARHDLRMDGGSMQAQLEVARERVHELEGEVRDAKTRMDELLEESAALKEELHIVEQQHELAEIEERKARQRCGALEGELDGSRKELVGAHDEARARERALERDLREAQQQVWRLDVAARRADAASPPGSPWGSPRRMGFAAGSAAGGGFDTAAQMAAVVEELEQQRRACRALRDERDDLVRRLEATGAHGGSASDRTVFTARSLRRHRLQSSASETGSPDSRPGVSPGLLFADPPYGSPMTAICEGSPTTGAGGARRQQTVFGPVVDSEEEDEKRASASSGRHAAPNGGGSGSGSDSDSDTGTVEDAEEWSPTIVPALALDLQREGGAEGGGGGCDDSCPDAMAATVLHVGRPRRGTPPRRLVSPRRPHNVATQARRGTVVPTTEAERGGGSTTASSSPLEDRGYATDGNAGCYPRGGSANGSGDSSSTDSLPEARGTALSAWVDDAGMPVSKGESATFTPSPRDRARPDADAGDGADAHEF